MNRATRLLRAWEHLAEGQPLVAFIDELLRGFGQVMFQNSPLTGLLFLIGVFGGGWRLGACAVLGTAASTLTARWLGVPQTATKAGLYGYNGTLVGVALAVYLGGDLALPFYVAFAGIVVAVVSAAIGNLLGTWQVPALTGPFVVTAGIFALGIYGFGRLDAGMNVPGPALPIVQTGGRAALAWQDIPAGVLHGVSQTFLQAEAWIGAIFLLGLLASSQIDFVMAIIGSAVGLTTGWALGVDANALSLGLMGYNAVLTMIALGGLYYLLDRYSFALAVIAAATSVVVAVALSATVAPFGGAIFTGPFVVTAWAFIAAKPFLRKVRAIPPVDATTPEANLNLYRRRGHWWDRAADS